MARGKKKGRRQESKWIDRSSELEMSNEKFENYYKAQQILPEDEWNAFMHSLRQPLPSTFRIAANRQMKDVLSDAIRNSFIPKLKAGSFDGEPLPVPQPIPWYPEGLAWHVNLARKELKKAQDYKKFHEFLVYETEVGNISRQEAVSMLPPLFLDVRPHHNAIDLCAAPGSKTSQLIEAMDPPSGILIANDADHKRAHLLVHQSSRLPSPGLMVTNLDASVFPTLKHNDRPLRFDRILADVPCSGDGTIRKNVGIWKGWTPMEGNGLHSLQLRILQRAMRMLKHDSSASDKPRIVYSTCSLNPVENEAVIAAALNSIPGFELVDVSDTLPALMRRPGITSWRPAIDRDVNMPFNMPFTTYRKYIESIETIQTPPADDEPKEDAVVGDGNNKPPAPVKKGMRNQSQGRPVRNKMLETHWPPANASELNLERSMRIYPHLQDSGGFFVAVIERRTLTAPKSAAPSKSEGKRPSEGTDANGILPSAPPAAEPVAKKARIADDSKDSASGVVASVDTPAEAEPIIETGGTFKEDPYTFISPNDPSLVSCIEKLNLSPSFPRSNIFVRNPDGAPVRSLYLVNDVVKSVMTQTDYTRIRLVSAGVKLFGRSEIGNAKALTAQRESEGAAKIQFRVLSEGLLALLPYVDEAAMIVGGPRELRILLEVYHPLCASFEGGFRMTVEDCSLGSHIIRFAPGDYGNATLSHDLFLPLWKSDHSISLMVDKKAKSALSLRVFGEDITVAGRQAMQIQEAKNQKRRGENPEDSVPVAEDGMDEDAVPAAEDAIEVGGTDVEPQ